jgi:hypothetical protein
MLRCILSMYSESTIPTPSVCLGPTQRLINGIVGLNLGLDVGGGSVDLVVVKVVVVVVVKVIVVAEAALGW